MKNIILFLVVFLSAANAQTNLFSSFDFIVLGGINSVGARTAGPSLIIEARTNLTQNLFLKASFGFSKIYKEEYYSVKTYREGDFLGEKMFFASSYDVKEKTFDVIPFTIGLQYVFNYKKIAPYIISDISYNEISTKIIQSNIKSWSYNNFEDVPASYRVKHKEDFSNNSLSIAIGLGTKYYFLNNLSLDFRYFYNYYFQIIDTHQFMLGLSF